MTGEPVICGDPGKWLWRIFRDGNDAGSTRRWPKLIMKDSNVVPPLLLSPVFSSNQRKWMFVKWLAGFLRDLLAGC